VTAAKPVRVQLSRKKGWRMPPNTVGVARPGGWGNPYSVNHKKLHVDGTTHDVVDRATAVRLHREWIEHWLKEYPTMLEPLRGKNLACWCPLDQPCHADTLLEISNR